MYITKKEKASVLYYNMNIILFDVIYYKALYVKIICKCNTIKSYSKNILMPKKMKNPLHIVHII